MDSTEYAVLSMIDSTIEDSIDSLNDSVKTLNALVVQMDKSSTEQSKKLNVLTWVLVISTIILIGITLYQVFAR